MKRLAFTLLLLSALTLQAQRIESGSMWYNGALVYNAIPDGVNVRMNAMAEGEELEFILVPAKNEPGRYHITTSPNSGIDLYDEGTIAKRVQREGLDLLCLYKQDGRLFRVLSKTDEWDNQKLNVEHWMHTVRGSYTMEDGTRVTIDWDKALIGGVYCPVKAVAFNGMVTGLIHFDGEGSPLNGDMEVIYTIDGLHLFEAEFDDFGMWHRLPGNGIKLTECDPNCGRYDFANHVLLYGNDLYDYDETALRLMRNSIYARHGYVFQSSDLQEYFGNEPWYKPCEDNNEIQFSFIERLNIQLIQYREAELKTEH